VGSNLATGSIANVGEHPLLRNLYFGVSTTLATDAQGVMNTTLADEYRRAAELIERFRRGEIALQIGTETKRYSDLTPEQQDRFSLRWLEQQVANYRDASRPKPKSGNEDSMKPEPSKEDR